MRKTFNPVLKEKIDYTPRQERKKVEEPTVVLKPCCVCNKTITQGYYGRHGDGGTCCKKCEDSFKPNEVNHENFTAVNSFNGSVYRPC